MSNFFFQSGIVPRLNKLEAADKKTRRDLRREKRTTAKLEDQVDRLTLTCTAMWELMRDHLHLSDQQLIARMGEIDRRDGVVDGKLKSPELVCVQCEKKNFRGRKTCLYCKAELPLNLLP